jgi:hypothetical protein
MQGKMRGYLLCHAAKVCRPSRAARETYMCWLVRADCSERLTSVENSINATLRTFQLFIRPWNINKMSWLSKVRSQTHFGECSASTAIITVSSKYLPKSLL